MKNLIGMTLLAAAVLFAGGCIERELTITTEPSGANVILNDEEIGVSPVTVSFNWYGTYKVKLEKEGYGTIDTNQELERPAEDYFPLDLFAGLFSKPGTVRSYQWDYELAPYEPPQRDELIERAGEMQTEATEVIESGSV